MEELIGRLVADVGDARAAVGTGVGIFSTSWSRKDLPTKCN
jgi:hypothetical protein